MAFVLNYQTTTVNLPSPEWDDHMERKYRRIVRESRGKELIVTPKSGFYNLNYYNVFEYKFRFLSELLKQHLINFLDTSVGQEINITDYNNVTYQGLILTSSIEIINASRNNNEFTLEIEHLP